MISRKKAAAKPRQCPIHYAVEMFGDKWSLVIIRDLMFFAKRHYSDFLKSPDRISTNILAARLVSLEKKGIITKAPDKTHGAKYVYSLTEKGLALMPVMLCIINWSATFNKFTAVPEGFMTEYAKDKDVFQARLRRLYDAGIPAVKSRAG
jgi:DNA-binding HxlR family transcriptional regulator